MSALRGRDLALSWLGHASVAAHIGGVSLVVDPVVSHRIGMKLGNRTIGPARMMPSPVSTTGLRGVDLILITHAHFDHLDKPTLLGLAHAATLVVVPPGCDNLIPAGFARVVTLPAGKTFRFADLTITAIEPRHWGARTVLDRHRRVNSYLVESASSRLLLAGDTAATDIYESLGQVDVAALGIGAYEPWRHMHATPEEVWDMATAMHARHVLPIHHSTFELSDEPPDEPLRRLICKAANRVQMILQSLPGEIVVPSRSNPDTPPSR
jgi:L-ascorbate metabolism protein UlaG (beta-lactamase superfamily)